MSSAPASPLVRTYGRRLAPPSTRWPVSGLAERPVRPSQSDRAPVAACTSGVREAPVRLPLRGQRRLGSLRDRANLPASRLTRRRRCARQAPTEQAYHRLDSAGQSDRSCVPKTAAACRASSGLSTRVRRESGARQWVCRMPGASPPRPRYRRATMPSPCVVRAAWHKA